MKFAKSWNKQFLVQKHALRRQKLSRRKFCQSPVSHSRHDTDEEGESVVIIWFGAPDCLEMPYYHSAPTEHTCKLPTQTQEPSSFSFNFSYESPPPSPCNTLHHSHHPPTPNPRWIIPPFSIIFPQFPPFQKQVHHLHHHPKKPCIIRITNPHAPLQKQKLRHALNPSYFPWTTSA